MEEAPEPEAPAISSEDTLSWLNELQGIVTSVTRPLEPLEDEPVYDVRQTRTLGDEELNLNNSSGDYVWPEAPAPQAPAEEPPVEELPVEDEPTEAAWLESVNPDDLIEADAEEPSELAPLAPGPSLLSGLLRQEPASGEPDEEMLIPEEELQTGWLTDDLLDDEDSGEPESPKKQLPHTDFFGLLEKNADVNLLARTGELKPPVDPMDALEDQPQSPPDEPSGALSEADFMESLSFDEMGADNEQSASDDEDVLGAWMDQQSEQGDEGEGDNDDFFASLGVGGDLGAQPTPDDFFASLNTGDEGDEQPASDDDALNAWMNPQGEQGGDDNEDFLTALGAGGSGDDNDDFFASLNTGDEGDEQPASDGDALDAWMNPQGEQGGDDNEDFLTALGAGGSGDNNGDFLASLDTGDEGDDNEDFLTALGIGDEGDEQPAAASDKDFFASLGITDDEQDQQPTDDESEVGDFFASLGIDENDEGVELPAASEEDVYGQWGIEPPEDQSLVYFDEDKGSSAAPPAASEEDLYGQGGAQADETFSEEDFLASLGMDDDEENAAPPAASEEDEYGEWGAQPKAQEEYPQDDFFASLGVGGEENTAPPAASEEDEYGQWGAQADEMPSEEDIFASFNEDEPPLEEDAPRTGTGSLVPNWVARAEMPPEEDFFASLGMIDEEQPEQEAPLQPAWQNPQEAPPEEDFFSALGMIGDEPQPEEDAPIGDIDSYLASLTAEGPEVTPETDEMFDLPQDVDIDTLFSEPVMSDEPETPPASFAEGDIQPGVNEDWLAQFEASVGEVSASAIVRQKEDRPVEELPDRLRKLRERSETLSDELPPDEALGESLPGVPNALTPAPFVGGAMEQMQAVALTREQQAKVDLLKALVPIGDSPKPFRMSAIEATFDSPFMTDLEDTEDSIVQPAKPAAPAKPQRRRRRRQPRQRIHVDRLLIALLLAAAVILPFVASDFRVGSLPPEHFAPGSLAQTAFDQMDAIKPSSLVLIGVEYSPSSAAELDGMTDVLVRHILMRAAFPVIISSNPLGLLRSEDLINSINDDSAFLQRIGASQPLQANKDYFIVRYLPGSVIGLRAFSQDTANLILSDVRGQATSLVVRSMHEFSLVAVITDRAEDMRAYAEQIAPLAQAPLVSAVSYSAAPLAEPYARARDGGLLVGYADAYTYADTLGLTTALSIAQRIRIVPTNTPQPTRATATPLVTPTPEPTRRPTATRSAPTLVPTPSILGSATVISRQTVNMRSGPGTDNDIVAAVPSGAVVTAIQYNDNQTWVNVRIGDGREGWISAALLSIEPASASPKKAVSHPRRQRVDEGGGSATPSPFPTPTATVDVNGDGVTAEVTAETTAEAATATRVIPTSTPRPTRTPSPTATPTIEATPEVTSEAVAALPSPPPSSPGYRDERWYAMNLGIIASAVIITFGAVFNVARGLLRRGRRG